MGETNTAATSDVTPTEADLARDLCIMLQQVEHDIAWLKVQPKPEGAVFDPKDLARSMEGLAAALRRAIAAEARVKELEQVLLQGVEQLKSMRAETDRLSREAELFKQHLGVQE